VVDDIICIGDLIRSKYFYDAIGIVLSEPHTVSRTSTRGLHVGTHSFIAVDVMWSFGECNEIPVHNLDRLAML